MRKIINSTYISLDGVIENPQDWPASDVDDPDSGTIQTDLLYACDAVLMGRRTYEGFAPVWQTRSGDPMSDRINSMRKYVVSSTLHDPDWANAIVIAGDPVNEISRIKAESGDIVQYGFGRLSYTLMHHGLLDELRLWVHPFFVGRAQPSDLLFRAGPPAALTLTNTRTLKSGIVILYYAFTGQIQ